MINGCKKVERQRDAFFTGTVHERDQHGSFVFIFFFLWIERGKGNVYYLTLYFFMRGVERVMAILNKSIDEDQG